MYNLYQINQKPAKPGTYHVFGGGARICAGNICLLGFNSHSFYIICPQNKSEQKLKIKKQKLIEEVRKFSIQKSSPLQALNKIAEWQDTLN